MMVLDMNTSSVGVTQHGMWRLIAAEFVGTAMLVAVVIGSGIAAQRYSPGDLGLQLLENSAATALGLAVLIVVLQPVSGGHLNPLITLSDWALGARLERRTIASYLAAQLAGAALGAVVANLMFDAPVAVSTTARAAPGSFLGEVVATAGLVFLVFGFVRRGRTELIGPAVGAYIGAAIWFSSSNSFANPAAMLGRVLTDTFTGVDPASALVFLGAQLLGGALGVGLVLVCFPRTSVEP